MKKAVCVFLILMALAGCAVMKMQGDFKVGDNEVKAETDGGAVAVGVKGDAVDVSVEGTIPQTSEIQRDETPSVNNK